jgi:hypothetical protein
MNETLKNELLNYLGELKCDYEKNFDWYVKDGIAKKIKAVNAILGFEEKIPSWFEGITKFKP